MIGRRTNTRTGHCTRRFRNISRKLPIQSGANVRNPAAIGIMAPYTELFCPQQLSGRYVPVGDQLRADRRELRGSHRRGIFAHIEDVAGSV